jgi:hypothetical protein
MRPEKETKKNKTREKCPVLFHMAQHVSSSQPEKPWRDILSREYRMGSLPLVRQMIRPVTFGKMLVEPLGKTDITIYHWDI